MGIFRLYTGPDGESHIEAVTIPDVHRMAALRPSSAIALEEDPPGTFLDWHPAPRRQWVVILSGELEIGLGDGTLHRFGAGDARLVEDTTGRGHTTRVVGSIPCLMMFLPVERDDRGH